MPAKKPTRKAAAARLPMPNLEGRTAYRFAILAALGTRCLADMYTRRFGLSVPGWRALAVIGHYDGISPGEVGARTSMDPAKITRAVDRLVKRDWVARSNGTLDRRRFFLGLTPKGRAVFVEIERVRAALEANLLEGLTKAERTQLMRLLERLQARALEIFAGRDAWKRIAGGPPV